MNLARRILAWTIIFSLGPLCGSALGAEEARYTDEAPGVGVLIWVLICAALIMFMQAGFALVEAGFVRAKNVCNIIMKNTLDFSISSIVFFVVGFGIMFGEAVGGLFGTSLFGLSAPESLVHPAWLVTFFVFHVMFAGTAATIVSGAVAERMRFGAYLACAVFISLIVYPVFGKWAWGGALLGSDAMGWLQGMGFHDFAGSSVVHGIGGWSAAAGAMVLGARVGKFDSRGNPQAIPGHSMPMAALGVFILFFGWFGFNGGSTLDGASPQTPSVFLNTLLSGASGAIAAMLTTWFLFGKPETGLTLNGLLAGLVSITAGANVIHPHMAIVTGAVGGTLVVFSVMAVEKTFRLDDPVGVISVHGVCGAWGTLALGIPGFSKIGGFSQLSVQAVGVLTAFAWAFASCFVLFSILKAYGMLRVAQAAEVEGLDSAEHANEAYPKKAWDERAVAVAPH